MWSVKKLFGFILLAAVFAGCGGAPGSTSDSMPQATLGGPIIMTSHKFTPPGYPFYIVYFIPQTPAAAQPQDPGTGEVVLDEGSPPPPESEAPPAPAPTGHVLISGSLVHSGYAEGSFLVEARPSIPCGDTVCADMSAMPLASVKVVKPGYFALVTPRTDAEIFVVITYTHPTDGTSTREQHLGVVGERVNGIVLDFSPAEPASAEPLVPDVDEAIDIPEPLDPWD